MNPSASGIHLDPVHQGSAEGRREARRDRSARDAAGAAGRPAPGRAAGHRPASWRWPSIAYCSRAAAPTRRSSTRTRPAPTRCASAPQPWTIRARRRGARTRRRTTSRTFADLYARRTRPALIRCGWGSSAIATAAAPSLAILALPAVGGKFGVRGGGYTMSNSASWGIDADLAGSTPEPPTRVVNMNQLGRVLLEPTDPPVDVLFVYNCNPAATCPTRTRVLAGPGARRPVHGGLRAGDDRHGAACRRGAAGDDVPRALRLRARATARSACSWHGR